MCWLAHLGLKVPKRVRHALVREDEPDNVNKGTLWKTEYDGVGHDLLLGESSAEEGLRCLAKRLLTVESEVATRPRQIGLDEVDERNSGLVAGRVEGDEPRQQLLRRANAGAHRVLLPG